MQDFSEWLHDRTRSAVFGYDNFRTSDLARQTMRLLDGGPAKEAAVWWLTWLS